MLDFQLQQAPFRFGLAEGVDPHQVPFGTLLTAENVVWTKSGRLEKRRGTSTLVRSIIGGGNISAAARLLTRSNELCVIDGTNIYSLSETAGGWSNRANVPEVGLTWDNVLDTTGGVRSADVGVLSNGYIVRAWVEGHPEAGIDAAGTLDTNDTPIYVMVIDPTDESIITAPKILARATPSKVRVVTNSTNYVVLWTDKTNHLVASVNGGAPTNLKSDVANTGGPYGTDFGGAFDACVIGSLFVVMYETTGTVEGANKLPLYSFSFASPPVQQASGSIHETSGGWQASMSIDGASGETLYCGYAGTGSELAKLGFANPSTLAETTARVTVYDFDNTSQDLCLGVCRLDSTHCIYAVSAIDVNTPVMGTQTYKVSSGGTVATPRVTANCCLISRPFMLGSTPYIFLADFLNATGNVATTIATYGINTYLAAIETTALTADTWWPHRYVGKVDILIGGRWWVGGVMTPAVLSSTQVVALVPFQATAETSFPWRQGLRQVTASIGASLPVDYWRNVCVGQESYLAAGVLNAYDGFQSFDYGFSSTASIVTMTTSGAGGSIATGSYLYTVVPEFRSNAGMLHRGPTYAGITESVTGPTGLVGVFYFNAPLSTKQSSAVADAAGFDTTVYTPLMATYRTIAGGSTFHRLTWEPEFNTGARGDYTGGYATFTTDIRNDSDIGNGTPLDQRPGIYTAGGVLDDYQPPAFVTLFYHRDRLWGLDGSRTTWWYSKSFQDDLGVAPGFNPAFRFTFDRKMTAGCSMEEKAVLFSSDRIWYVLGEGPNRSGQSSDMGLPIPISTQVGCNNARSTVETPDGVMFGATNGIYLITRGLEVVFIGRAVQDEYAAYPNITSAVLVQKRSEVRFTCNNNAGNAGIVLIYNYVEKQWSTFKYTVNSVYGAPIADAVMWQGQWTFVTPGGYFMRESESTYLDGSTWVPLTIETAWVSAAGPLAFHSVRMFSLEGISNSNHDLTIACTFDGDTSYPQTKTFVAGGAVTTIGPLESCDITIGTHRKCQHIRFKITDATPSGGFGVSTGQGPSFDTMGIEVGIKRGFASNPATKKG